MTRSLATLGIAFGGILSLVSGVAVLATITTRTIPILMALFVVGVLITAGSVVGFLISEGDEADATGDERR